MSSQIFLSANAEQKGLLDLQHEVIRAPIIEFASNPENFRDRGNPPVNIPWPHSPVHLSGEILKFGHSKTDDLLKTVVQQTFRAFIGLQLQGLTLLSMGWLGSIHEAQVAGHIRAIQPVLDAMMAFEGKVKVQSTPSSLNAFKSSVAACRPNA